MRPKNVSAGRGVPFRLLAFSLCIIVMPTEPSRAIRNPVSEAMRTPMLPISPRVSGRSIKYGPRYSDSFYVSPANPKPGSSLIIILSSSEWRSATSYYDVSWLRFRLTEAGYTTIGLTYGEQTSTAQEALKDIVSGLSAARQHAVKWDVKWDRLALVGTNGGAHFATLLATDKSYFDQAGVPFSNLRAVASINGDGFDVPRRMATGSKIRVASFRKAFGQIAEDQVRLSPVSHATDPNAPDFLFFALADEGKSILESQEMINALKGSSSRAALVKLPPKAEDSWSSVFLAKKDGAGHELLDFLAKTLKD